MKGARRRWLGEGWGSEDDQNMYEMIKELIKHHIKEIMNTEEKSDRLLFQSEFEMPLIDVSAEPLVFQLLALFWEAVRNLGGGASLQEGGPSGCVLSISRCWSSLLVCHGEDHLSFHDSLLPWCSAQVHGPRLSSLKPQWE